VRSLSKSLRSIPSRVRRPTRCRKCYRRLETSGVRLKPDTTRETGPPQGGRYERLVAASRKPSNSGRNSPVRQKFSGCHWTPRQKRAAGSSIVPDDAAVPSRTPGNRQRPARPPAVAAVCLAGVGVAQPFAHQPREQRVLVDPDFVREVAWLVRGYRPAVLERTRNLGGNVLHQRAAARDI
jgi:hypothetical protein